jgi:formiminotetrahydrofolate cyclodeaminase
MRTDTIDSFLRSLAARVPAPGGGATAALHVAQAAALLLPVGNRNVVSDVAVAAEAARAAAVTARVNIEINLAGIEDVGARADLLSRAGGVDDLTQRADKVTAAVRAELVR